MIRITSSAALIAVVITFWTTPEPYKPDFSHDAFSCNYLFTVCRDKTSVLPVDWRRYTP